MIIDAILMIVLGIFTGILALLPDFQAPELGSFGASAGSALATANAVFPVTVLGACIAVILGARLFVVAFGLLVWVYDKIPFKGT